MKLMILRSYVSLLEGMGSKNWGIIWIYGKIMETGAITSNNGDAMEI